MSGPSYRYAARCVRVVDGDTYHLDIDLGFRAHLTVPVRLRGVDTPELTTEEGKEARTFAINTLIGVPVLVESYRDRQSFARWVCDIWLLDGRSLADVIVAAGHGEAAQS